jgi:SOS-response transcriptional repressor LexA
MAWRNDQVYHWDGCVYVPYHTARVSAGPFLSFSPDSVEEHLELDANFSLAWSLHGGVRVPKRRLVAAKVHGDSMINKKVSHCDIIVFQCGDFNSVRNGNIVVIGKVGEEEGLGAWALKKLVIERPRSFSRDEYDDERDWDSPLIVLRSSNPNISPSQLDPKGQYRVHGVFLQSLPPDSVTLVDSDTIRRRVAGWE